jgi:superfamily II DNA or RNA helicase
MKLRPRQSAAVAAAHAALDRHGNTLLVAPTGAGKSIMLSAIAGARGGKALVLQHRGELLAQNARAFRLVHPRLPVSLFDAASKSFRGRAVFATVQALLSDRVRLPAFRILAIDEAHHAVAESYASVIARARAVNPGIEIFGATATPRRGDGVELRALFDNVADEITLAELTEAGALVRPRIFTPDIGKDGQIADRAIALWAKGDAAAGIPACRTRATLAFCASVAQAEQMAHAFRRAGIAAAALHGALPAHVRAVRLDAFARGRIKVLANVAVLTEGFDHPPVGCVMLLRPCGAKALLTQMIGRGLRAAPGKRDCVVLDFGASFSEAA